MSNVNIYHSFAEWAEAEYDIKPTKKATKDKQKLKAQREKFAGTCPYCKQPCEYIYGTNVVVCTNEKCKGKKISSKSLDGEDRVKYKPFFRLLSDEKSEFGRNIFSEEV